MRRICEICEKEYDTNSKSRIYCYECSGESTRADNTTRKHQKTILRRSMKVQAIKLLGDKCCKCGYDKCVDALEFQLFYENDDTLLSFRKLCKYYFTINSQVTIDYINFYREQNDTEGVKFGKRKNK